MVQRNENGYIQYDARDLYDFEQAGVLVPASPQLCLDAIHAAIGLFKNNEYLRANDQNFARLDAAENATKLGQRIYAACPPAFLRFTLGQEDLLR